MEKESAYYRILWDAEELLQQQSLEEDRQQAYLNQFVGVMKRIDNPAFLEPFDVEWHINTDDEPSLDLVWKDEYHDCVVSVFHDGYFCAWWVGIKKEKRFAEGFGGEDETTGLIDYSSLDYFIELVEDGDAELQDYLHSHKTN